MRNIITKVRGLVLTLVLTMLFLATSSLSAQNAFLLNAPESNTIFTAGGSVPPVGQSDFVGPQLTLPNSGSYLIFGTIATTLKNASTATCWIVELPSTQISPLTYAGSETPAVTTLWLPLTMVTQLTIGSSETIQMECTNNAGSPELGPFTLVAIQVSSIGG